MVVGPLLSKNFNLRLAPNQDRLKRGWATVVALAITVAYAILFIAECVN